MSGIPLIPRKILFDNPDRTLVRISPDGDHLAWLAPRDGVLNVWVAPRQDLEAAQPVTHLQVLTGTEDVPGLKVALAKQ